MPRAPGKASKAPGKNPLPSDANRVAAGGDLDDLHFKIHRQHNFQRPDGGFNSGGVGVERDIKFISVAFKNPCLFIGESCTLRRYGIAESGAVHGNYVELSFAENGETQLLDFLPGQRQRVEDVAFFKNRRFRTVDVFRAF